MSTDLTPINGRIEIPNSKSKESIYKSGELQITYFYGGDKNGPMIQFGIENDHIQLNKEQVRLLIHTLINWL